MKKITELTPEQKIALPQCRETWRKVGLSTDPVHPDAARTAVKALYAAGGLPEPKAVFVMSSPMMCLLARGFIMSIAKDKPSENQGKVAEKKLGDQLRGQLGDQLRGQLGDQLRGQLRDQLWGQLRDQLRGQLRDQLWGQLWDQLGGQLRDQLGGQLRDQLWGQLRDQLGDQLGDQKLFEDTWFAGGQDAFWIAFYEFGRQIGARYGASTDAHFMAYKDYALRCGWMYAYKEIAFVSDRPQEIHFDAGTRLHSDAGMAVRFRDGWGVYAWHGLRLPADREWIVADKAKLTPAAIDAETNAEFRRVMLEAYGFDKYLAERGAAVLDADELHGQPRRLMEVKVGGEALRVVEVINGSDEPDGTRRKFVLGAARASDRALPKTAHAAIAASYGISAKVYREAVRS